MYPTCLEPQASRFSPLSWEPVSCLLTRRGHAMGDQKARLLICFLP